MKIKFLLLPFLFFCFFTSAEAQRRSKNQPLTTVSYDKKLYEGLKWRHIGPFRGGRSAAVTGVPNKPSLYYMGTTGGGVWRTQDAGNSWENISDGYFGGSIGAIAVSEWDDNVIYVGGGEVTVRGNVSSGTGMYKSVDAGKTWQSIGLKNARHISRIRVHPKDDNVVFVAVLGDIFKPSNERGVYKSTDGGKTWEKVLFVNSNAGVVDLAMDPNNSRVLYASTWRVRRTPYSLESGGEGSALWKSTDGGKSWDNISSNEGLPKGIWGINGVTVSPVNSNRVWTIVENENGGVFRSDDAGKTWKKTNEERKLRQRAWYYSRIFADSQDQDIVYVMNVSYHKSKDGGKTFESFNAPHGDHHDFWVAPENNQRMIIGDDGGGQVSNDGGMNWTTYHNQPTAQFYRVTTDNHFPYRIYGAQQDNSTIRIAHRTSGGSITERNWEPTAGGESAHIAIKPDNNDVVYGGSYDGFLTRVNHQTEEIRAVNVWPDNPMGHGAEDFKYRFQWNFPIFFSPHNPNKLYTASNHLHMSEDEGQSWKLISPDLTRNDSTKLKSSGGPITQDNTGVEYYCTIFAAVESSREEGLIWTGSDDGLIHLTKNGGESWKNVTPKNMPEWMMINSIEIDPFQKGGAYVAGTRYKMGDFKPYLYKTEDYGETWKKIVNNIPNEHFTRVLRADPKSKGLLYAGTEYGMYVSFDDGESWSSFQQNLPIVPITDLAIKNDNLIAATQGRSFWIIDDLTVMHQMSSKVNNSDYYLFKPMDNYRMRGNNSQTSKTTGENHPGGIMMYYYLKDTVGLDTLKLSVVDNDGKQIRGFSNYPDEDKKEEKLDFKPGLNRCVWDMRYTGADSFDGMILWWVSLKGPKAVPGEYKVKMTVNGKEQGHSFKILKDPRVKTTPQEFKEQFEFLNEVIAKLSETNNAVKKIRKSREQLTKLVERMEDDQHKEIREKSNEMLQTMKHIEEALYQTKNRSRQDPLNFPVRLNNKIGHLNSLYGMGDFKPTNQAVEFKNQVTKDIDMQLEKLNKLFDQDVPKLNEMMKFKKLNYLMVE